ncbi:SRPBCC family protein [Actinomadura montaniterrae]|uniref:Coenzyme Q-binding protein COQ10 START domain-containing protein n=1 Tax=Actinomadura montaniterrae TaxID=1803903 RepID=A0A6L3W6K3_9ACTN|nr:SRPBCC family protein [Actinomadura montaniterrae]KAB2390038.1 hypothetical protein F9B16_01990 [Actinomadura montaniterrae]
MIELSHETTVAAAPDAVYELVADVVAAPRYFPPHLHAEILAVEGGRDLVERWVLDGGSVRSWRFHREADEAARRIVFEHAPPRPPLKRLRGEWTFEEKGAGTFVRVRHTLEAPADAAAVAGRIGADLDEKVPMQLRHLAKLAAGIEGLRARTVDRTVEVRTDAPRPAVYAALLDGATSDERTWARACLPEHTLAYKSRKTPEDAHSLTGTYRLTDGRVIASRAVVLADGADLEAARARLADELDRELASLPGR